MQKPLPPRRLAVQGESDMEEGELLSDSGHRAFSIAKTTNGHRAGQPGHDGQSAQSSADVHHFKCERRCSGYASPSILSILASSKPSDFAYRFEASF